MTDAFHSHPVIQFLARAGGWPHLLRPGDVFDRVAARERYLRVGNQGYLPVFDPEGRDVAFMEFTVEPLDAPIRRIAETLVDRHMVGVHSSLLALATGPVFVSDALPLMKLVAAYARVLNAITAGDRSPIIWLVNGHDAVDGWRDGQQRRSFRAGFLRA